MRDSFGTLWAVQYLGKQALEIVAAESIHSVVGMIPFILSDTEKASAEICTKFSMTYFVSEKPFLDFLGTGDTIDEEKDYDDDADC